MPLSADGLRTELAGVFPAEGDPITRGTPLAAKLCSILEARRAEGAFEEIRAWAFNVEFVLKTGEPRYWTIECLSPNDFRMYPGFEREDVVVWANVWVRDNMTLDELVKDINGVAFRADEDEIEKRGMMTKERGTDYWFTPRRYGHGASPATWQGWVAIVAFPVVIGLVTLALFASIPEVWSIVLVVIFLPTALFAFIALVRKKTNGEWRWRWGDGE